MRFRKIITNSFFNYFRSYLNTNKFTDKKNFTKNTLIKTSTIIPCIAFTCYNNVFCTIITDQETCELISRYCKAGNYAEVSKLLKRGEDVNCRHSFGWNPLHAAVANSNYDIVKLLLKHGADVNSIDEFPGIIKLATRNHIHPTEGASIRRRDFGSDFNLQSDFTGCTPLHYAVFQGDTQMIKILLDSGADITIQNSYGETPYDLAMTSEIKELISKDFQKAIEKKQLKEIEERRKYPLENRLKEFIVGQDDAINTVSSIIRRRELGWTRGDKPIVLLFLGSSGVGKTELAKQLANYLFKDKKCFIRVDMSEYQQRHEVSKFIGAPPGYVGFDRGGQLTGNLNACPNAIVLFDEIEKAHPDIITIMLQLFDEGRLTDGQGNTTECPNAIFVMTSNLASEEIAKYATKLRLQQNLTEKGDITVSKQFKENVMYPILKDHFKRDEFLGRINDMIYFLPFTKSELGKLVEIELKFWSKQAYDKHKIEITWDPDILSVLADGYDIHYGARSLKHEVEKKIVNRIASLHEEGKIDKNSSLHLSVDYGSEESPKESPEILFKTKEKTWFKF